MAPAGEELGLTSREKLSCSAPDGSPMWTGIGSLRTLASLVEPVKEYRRYQMRPQQCLAHLRDWSMQRDRTATRQSNSQLWLKGCFPTPAVSTLSFGYPRFPQDLARRGIALDQ